MDLHVAEFMMEAFEITLDEMQVFFGLSSELFCSIGQDGYFQKLNSSWQQALGWTIDELAAQPWMDWVHPEDQVSTANAISAATIATMPIAFEHRYRHCNGEYRWLSWRISPFRSGTAYGVASDFTDRKRNEQETWYALERERELNELKSGFIAMVSHEFRTPLSTILCAAELLESYGYQWSEEKKIERLQRIKQAVQRMSQLLSEVLMIGKTEAGKLKFSPSWLDVVQFCQDLIEELQPARSLHRLTFQSIASSSVAWVDAQLLRHLLTNLMANALKYSPQGGDVQLEVSDTPNTICFQIQDHGIGIPAADQAQLFTLFQRGSNVGTISGTGLGLTIVKQCVDLHGGRITVASDVGKGTLFTVTLPSNPLPSNPLVQVHEENSDH